MPRCRINVTRTETGKPYAISLFPGTRNIPYCSDPFNKINLELAFRKRLNPELPLEDIPTLIKLQKFVLKFLNDRKNKLTPLPYIEDNYEKHYELWVNNVNKYNMNRIKQFDKCFYSTYKTDGKFYNIKNKHYYVNSFPKREFHPEPKNVRFINSRTDTFKALAGPAIHLIEQQIFTLKYFVKHFDLRELNQKIEKLTNYKYYIQSDYTSFEAGFSPNYCKAVERTMLNYFLQNNPNINQIIQTTYISHDEFRYEKLFNKRYTATTYGTRMSGEMWTSLGNSFSNLMNILFLCEENNIKCDGLIEGDDAVFGVSANILKPQDFSKLGFQIKMQYKDSIYDTSFCSNVINPHTKHILLDPELITRLNWSCSNSYFNSKQEIRKNLLRAKAISLYSNSMYTPIANVLSNQIIKIIGQGKMLFPNESKWWYERKGLIFLNEFKTNEICFSDRLFYQKKFGITVNEQIYIEKIIKKTTTLNQLYIPFYIMKKSYDTGCL